MILSKQKCCLLLNCVSTENQNKNVLQIRRGFSLTRNMSRINVGLAVSYVNVLLFSWKIYMQFEGMVYHEIAGIPMDTNCVPLIADTF